MTPHIKVQENHLRLPPSIIPQPNLVQRLHDCTSKHRQTAQLNIDGNADDTQLILSLSKNPTTAKANFCECMNSIANWMRDNCLKLNSDRTEILIFGSNTNLWPPTMTRISASYSTANSP